MNNLKFPLLITVFALMVFALGSCTDDPCDGVDCGANGIPIEDVVFGNCTCDCLEGFTNGPNGDCITDGCLNIECGNGTPVPQTDGTCFCNCEDGFINLGDGNGCVPECDATNCINGECGDNGCECDEGYEGDTCETLIISKFFGEWSVVESCVAEEEIPDVCVSWTDVTYNFTISQNGTNEMNVLMENFFGVDDDGDPFLAFLIADISGDNIDVTYQAPDGPYNYGCSGSGVYSVDDEGVETVTFDFAVSELDENDSPTCTVNCTSVWTKN